MTRQKCILWSSRLLLACFLAGGVVGPLVHRVQHAIEWRDAKAENAGERCDHETHDPAFERILEDLHEEPCVLCSAKITASIELSEAFGSALDDCHDLGVQDFILASDPWSAVGNRGPPLVS